MVHKWTVGRCIVYTGIRLLMFIRPFISSFFFLSNFQTYKFFVTLISETVWPRRLKLGTHVQWADVSCLPESGCCCLFIPLFFIFLSLPFSNINIFVTLFSGTVRLEDWNLARTWTVDRYMGLPESGCCCLFIPLFFIFLSLQFSNINIFVTLFSGTVRPRRLKLGTRVDSGQMYCVYRIQAAAVYLSLYFFIFLSLQFSNI